MSQEPEMQERVELALTPWRHDDGRKAALASCCFFFVSLVVVVLFLFFFRDETKKPKRWGKMETVEVAVFFFQKQMFKI